MRPVLVEWWDAHAATDAWTPRGEVDADRRVIRSVGFLVARDRDHLTVAQSVDDATDHVDQVLKIPRPVVLSVRPLDRRWFNYPAFRI